MAIQQHPLPQDISSYRFRLIGDMTIKQFASLGICIVLAIIAYSLPLPFFFKYPLSFMFIVLGVGMAFVPVQGRSLDVWILAFIRSIYSPTQYIWKRTDSTAEMSISSTNSHGTQAVSNARIELTQAAKPSVPQTPIVSITPPTVTKPAIEEAKTEAPVPELGQIVTTLAPVIPAKVDAPTPSEPVVTTPPVTPPATEKPTNPVIPNDIQRVIPAEAGIHPIKPNSVSTSTAPQQSQLPIPFTPTTPNTLVGLTLTPEGKILDGVMVEIQRNGLTSRATKSNKLGQFMFARPLENGLYQILAEKDSYTFNPYSLDLTGNIIRPLKIQAK